MSAKVVELTEAEVNAKLAEKPLQRGFYQKGNSVRWLYDISYMGPNYMLFFAPKRLALNHLFVKDDGTLRMKDLNMEARNLCNTDILEWFQSADFLGVMIPELRHDN